MRGEGAVNGPTLTFASFAPLCFILLWSSAFIAVRAGLPDVSPLFFLTIRFALASVLLIGLCLIFRPSWAALRRTWPHYLIAGCLINGLYLSAGYLAMTRITGATLALIGALQPVLTALLAMPLLGERFRPPQWLGFALGMAGVAVVVGLTAGDAVAFTGMLWGVAGMLCLTCGTLYYSRFCKGAPLLIANTLQLGAAAVLCALLTVSFEEVHASWTPTALATLLWLTVAVSLGGMGVLLFMLKHGAAAKVAANFYLTPGLTAVLGWLVLSETLAWQALAGFAVATLGVWLVNRG